ncbi:MAG: polyribonucleotide nucleotidyltransferase [Chloroflexi bacterium]|nr:polyribonucleotide nucleotidyltransferase [Chloroflexota bacterium]
MSSTFTREFGSGTLSVESGKVALQANGSVVIRYGDDVLLVTAVMAKPREGIDFFPLTVDVEERLYARGKIPGSFFRREGRPSTHATLVARLIDRPLRPLFPKGFRNEVQIIVTPLSVDQDNPFDTLAIIGASAALSISDIPFEGPIAACRVGYVDDQFVINPTYDKIEESRLDLIVASSRNGVIMMEAGASEINESLMLEAIKIAHDFNLEAIAFQEEIVSAIGRPKAGYESTAPPDELDQRVSGILQGKLANAFELSTGKADLASRLDELTTELEEALGEEFEEKDLASAFEERLEVEFRRRVLKEGKRPDGRGLREIRPISAEVALLPRAHGSGLFTRGETQILGVATLGSVGDAQKLDTLSPEDEKRFMLHYNFPPYSTGEARRVGSPGRREIGHGALAERALQPVIPDEEDFPYTLRVVCEALGSNGSTSMGSVCAGTLALMDAGVPIKKPVAGISVGLVTGDSGEFVTLTDIQGMEDHVGGMDFKVAGTADGITAIQLDIKVKSINFDMVQAALEQAREARLFILDKLRGVISEARATLSPYAPRMVRIQIPVSKIGTVIGPAGKVIRGIIEATGATVDIEDDGTVTVGSVNEQSAQKAISMIEDLTREVKVGDIYTGKVTRLMNFGAFVEILPGRDGLVHISELADYHVPRVEDVVQIGDEITVVVREIDSMGRINLSRRALMRGEGEENGEGGDDGDGGRGGPGFQGAREGGRPPARTGGYRPRNGGRPGGGGGPRGGGRPGGGPRYGDRRPPQR